AEGQSLPRLRDVRLRRRGGRARRRVRPLPRPPRRVLPVEPHPAAGPRTPARRSHQRGRPAGDPPSQVAGDERHGGDDLSLQAGHGGRESAGGRGLRRDREPEGRARDLPGVGRHRETGAVAHPAALIHQPLGPFQDGGGTPVERPDRDHRVGRHRHGRGGAMSVGAHPLPQAGTEEYQPVFVGKTLEHLSEILTRYPTRQAALLPALWLVQQARGWISDRNMAEVADVLGLTAAYVKGVVTFYTMYHQHPVGRHFVQVCTTSPCNICGAEAVVQALLDATGARELGATSPAGKWTGIEVECLGACGFATPVLVNDDFIESVTPDKVPDLVKRYK